MIDRQSPYRESNMGSWGVRVSPREGMLFNDPCLELELQRSI